MSSAWVASNDCFPFCEKICWDISSASLLIKNDRQQEVNTQIYFINGFRNKHTPVEWIQTKNTQLFCLRHLGEKKLFIPASFWAPHFLVGIASETVSHAAAPGSAESFPGISECAELTTPRAPCAITGSPSCSWPNRRTGDVVQYSEWEFWTRLSRLKNTLINKLLDCILNLIQDIDLH